MPRNPSDGTQNAERLIRSETEASKYMQTLKLKGGKETTLYYRDPKLQILDAEIARKLFEEDNPGVDLDEIRREEQRFALSQVAKKKRTPKPKEKSLVIKDVSSDKPRRSVTRSQSLSADKGKKKVEDVSKQSAKSIDDSEVPHEEELIEYNAKRRKTIIGADWEEKEKKLLVEIANTDLQSTTSDTTQVVNISLSDFDERSRLFSKPYLTVQ